MKRDYLYILMLIFGVWGLATTLLLFAQLSTNSTTEGQVEEGNTQNFLQLSLASGFNFMVNQNSLLGQ